MPWQFSSRRNEECKSESSLKVGSSSVLQFSAQPQGGWSLEAALSGRKHINRSLRILGEKNWKQGGEGALLIMSRFRFSLAKLLFLIMTSVMSYYALEV